jgi:hypothetical protein
LVKGWIERHKGLTVIIHRQSDLQTAEISSFQSSLSDLIKKLDEYIPDPDKGYKIIFNLTGGFKSIQGFLQSIANFYADETVYIFETSSELLKIPKLPVRMVVLEEIENNILSFRQLSLGIKVDTNLLNEISETLLLFKYENHPILSAWGELMWEQSKKEIYEKNLLDPPIDKIRFSNKFKKNVSNLNNKRLFVLNTRIDQLAQYLEKGTNPKALDFKQIKGKAMLPSTHEIDAWSDLDAKRIFGHYDKEVFVLDKLDKGLH